MLPSTLATTFRRLSDAHNHLQDDRLKPRLDDIISFYSENQIFSVVNGSSEEDWRGVLDLSRRSSWVIPSFGYHPWYVRNATPEWRTALLSYLDQVPAAVGEVGLDRWRHKDSIALQREFFGWQLALAAERNLPLSVHCLQAWGELLQILETSQRPQCGFLLHSYGGSIELIPRLVKLGAYFSFAGYFLRENKVQTREVFKHVPLSRLLVETDAPDQCLPKELERHAGIDPETQERFNDPRNLEPVYTGLAEWLGVPMDDLCLEVDANFRRLFGSVCP